MNGATLFSGIGGAEALLNDVIDFQHAVEIDPIIAAAYRRNHGDYITVADVCDVDFTLWGHLTYLHGSPVCKSFSSAASLQGERPSDARTANAIIRCIEATTPDVFTLENVRGYMHFDGYKRIRATLQRLGYTHDATVVNAAHYGVPQTRQRLIVRAVCAGQRLPALRPAQAPVGWFTAIRDIVDQFTPAHFADWQRALLPSWAKLDGDVPFVVHSNDMRSMPVRSGDQPIFTLLAASHASHAPDIRPRAYVPGLGIVKCSLRMLARFQSLPDSFIIPDKVGVAVTCIGNVVPSRMMHDIVTDLL